MRKAIAVLLIFVSSYVYSEHYERIISLGPAITEEIYLLGAQDKLVGVTTYCIRPKEADEKEKVGTVMQFSVEKIISLKPDIVIGTPLSDKRQLKKIEDMGINVVIFPSAKNFNDICNQFMELSRIVGREGDAKRIVKEARKKVNKIQEKPKLRVFVQLGTRPIYTITKDSFINDYIKFAGGTSITSKERFGLYSREQVVKEDPDVIIITAMGITGENEKRAWQKFKEMKAVCNNRIYIIDSYKLCSPTPVSFAGMLEELVEILHG